MNYQKDIQTFLKERQHKKVVFTNGCFDILHRGHISYLNQAKAEGDILVLGLNSDASVKRLKGESRPINSEQDRKFILENLRCIDYVFIFVEDTPYELIQAIRPDVLVKGGDWRVEDIVGSELVLAAGGEVKSLNFIDGLSTTGIIEKITTHSK